MHNDAAKSIVIVGLIGLMALSGMIVMYPTMASQDVEGEDIYYLWVEGQRILSGENPYARVLTGNMAENQKYATYFPAFYWLSAFSQLLGLRDFSAWIGFWRVIFLGFDFGIASLMYVALDRYQSMFIGILAALFWLFNRWTLDLLSIADIDFLPLFFLVWSFLLLPKRQRTSLLLLSLSLAIKQIAIFLVPLYLLWVWQRSDQDRIRRVLFATAMIFSIPFVTSLPFLLWNAEGFIKSIAFSMTRNPDTHFGARSVGEWIGLTGIPDRLPMLGLLLMVYVGMFQRRLGMYVSALFVIVVFLDFNPVLFRQYMCWLVPFLPFVLCDESVIGVKHAKT